MIKRALLIVGFLSCTTSAFAQRDMVDISTAVVWNSPPDVASWPKTTSIDAMTMRPSSDREPGLAFTFPAHATWPDYTPPGWDGPIQYTVWAGVRINGVWNISGIIQMWREREATGAPMLTDFAINWVYDGRWGAMQGYQPQPGEAMIFFLTAGNARGEGVVTSVRERSNVVVVNLPANDYGNFTFSSSNTKTAGDFDGDGKADLAIYRPSAGTWAIQLTTGGNASGSGGQQSDVPVPGDYDGDGRSDLAVYRPSTGGWLVSGSTSNFSTYSTYGWGLAGDVPVPGDYDGDGRMDIAIYRPSTAQWWILWSSSSYRTYSVYGWGLGGSDVPVPGDYDGDGKTDIAIYRPTTGGWWVLKSTAAFRAYATYGWGLSGDVPVLADFDGDGKVDPAVYRPSSAEWWFLKSGNNYGSYGRVGWGLGGDVPVAADYDGDGKADVAIYRPSTGGWWVLKSSTNFAFYNTYAFGQSGDLPVVPRP